MPDTINFESLGAAYTDDIDAALELPISINSVVADGDTDLVFAYCAIGIVTGAGAGVEAPEVDTIQAELEIGIAMGFTAAYEVGSCDAELDLPISVESYVDVDTVAALAIPMSLEFEEGASMVPIDDEPGLVPRHVARRPVRQPRHDPRRNRRVVRKEGARNFIDRQPADEAQRQRRARFG